MAKNRPATLQFLGAAGTVTGSKYLVTSSSKEKFLLDCGLFQGARPLRQRNWRTPNFSVKALSAVVLSHAHIDHSGYLPVLARRGFHGPIYCTSATADLLHVLLSDAAYLQEEEARFANKKGYSHHKPALPLFTRGDAHAALKLLQVKRYDKEFSLGHEMSGLFQPAGHILGAATVQISLRVGGHLRRLAFSGDLGRYGAPILRDPVAIKEANILLLESTYGDRAHPTDVDLQLARIVHNVVARKGALIVPAFAVGRTQELIYRLRMLEGKKMIPSLPIYVDSPMASQVTKIYCDHAEEFDLPMQDIIAAGDLALNTSQLRIIQSVEESISLNKMPGPMIVIAGSGMATGGRVLHHLAQRLPNEKNTVLLVGFQAEGTRGRALQEKAPRLRIHGIEIAVRAHVELLDGLSAHAGQDEILRWLKGFHRPPDRVYLVHGESRSAEALKAKIEATLNWQVSIAMDRQTIEL